MKPKTKKALAVAGGAALLLWLFKGSQGATPAGAKTVQKPNTFKQILADPKTVVVIDPAPALVVAAIPVAQKTGGVIAINQKLNSAQIQAAVMAAIDNAGDGDAPSIAVAGGPSGVSSTFASESIAAAAAASGKSVADWGHNAGFW